MCDVLKLHEYHTCGKCMPWILMDMHFLFLWFSLIGYQQCVNSLNPGQNGHHFSADISRCIFLNKRFIFFIVSLTFGLNGPNDNSPTLVSMMAWRRIGDKPLSEPMPPLSLTQKCGTRGRWINSKVQVNMVSSQEWYTASQSANWHQNPKIGNTMCSCYKNSQIFL